jgi:hypothetical protein
LLKHTADLDGKLAGGREDQHLNGAPLRIDRFDRRNAEGQGLAGAGAGLTDDIAAIEQRRQRGR